MKRVAMLLGHDLLDPNLDFRVYREARSLIEAGYEVTVICWARRNEGLPPETTFEKIQLKRVFQSLSGSIISRALAFKKALKKLSVMAAAGDFDIIHAHDLETLPAAVRAAKKTNRTRQARGKFSKPNDRTEQRPLKAPASGIGGDSSTCKVVFDSHEDWPLMEKVQNPLLGYWMGFQQKRWMPRADAILTVSPELAARLEAQMPDKAKQKLSPISVLYNSEPLQTLENKADRLALEVELDPQRTNIGYIGGLRKQIIEELIRAVSKVPQTHLLVIGGPPKGQAGYESLMEGFQQYAEHKRAKVSFTGAQPYHLMPDYYRACDIILVGHYAHPLLRPYAVPKKLLDGMAYGIPVIAGPYQARQRIIEENRCGLILGPHSPTGQPATANDRTARDTENEPDDTPNESGESQNDSTAQWVSAIQHLVENPDERERLGKNGRLAFRQHFSWEKQAEKLVLVYRSLIQS